MFALIVYWIIFFCFLLFILWVLISWEATEAFPTVLIVIFLVFVLTLDYKKDLKSYRKAKIEQQKISTIYSFIQNINSDLAKKMQKIKLTISEIKEKINDLNKLKVEFSHNDIILKRIAHWKNLQKDLESSYEKIFFQMETSYVISQISEIQNHDNFYKTSQSLLKTASQTLLQAQTTQKMLNNE